MHGKTRKTLNILLVLSISLSLLSVWEFSKATSPPDEFLNFLTTVVKLDISAYNLTIYKTTVQYDEHLGGLDKTSGVIDLVSSTSKLYAGYQFINGTLSYCIIDVLEGTPLFTQGQPINVKEKAMNFLRERQSYTGDESLAAMKNMLESVDISKNSTQLSGYLKLSVTVTSADSLISYRWTNVYNGAAYTSMGLDFRNGFFSAFSDNRFYYSIGNTSVNLSKEDAIGAALKCVKNYSYSYAGSQVRDIAVAENFTSAELLTAPRDDPLVLYPYWDVRLPLASVYPGSIILIKVQFWADTGALNTIFALGTGGGFETSGPTPEPSSPTTTSQSSSSPASSPAPSVSFFPIPSAAPTPEPLAPQEPTPTASYLSLQPSSSPSLVPADGSKDAGSADLGLWVAAAFAAVAAALTLAFLVKKRRG